MGNEAVSGARLPLWRNAKKISISGHSVRSASRVLTYRFPYLRLENLARIKDLSVRHISETIPPLIYQSIRTRSEWGGQINHGRISFVEDTRFNTLVCDHYYPMLPQTGHEGLTLLFLILVRGNAFAGREMKGKSANEHARKMLSRMTDFSPREQLPRGSVNNVVITMPKLSDEELAAVEWYWRKVLHCPR